MKWNVDSDIQRLESLLECQDTPGTQIFRMLVDKNFLDSMAMVPPKGTTGSSFFIWGILIGKMGFPKYMLSHGFTIKEAYLKAYKVVKATLSRRRAEDRKKPGYKAPKKKEKKKFKKKKVDPT